MKPVALLILVAGAALAQPAVMRLGLKDAVRSALAPDGNARARSLARELVRQAKAGRWRRPAGGAAAECRGDDGRVRTNPEPGRVRHPYPIAHAGFPLSRDGRPVHILDLGRPFTQSVFDISAIRR